MGYDGPLEDEQLEHVTGLTEEQFTDLTDDLQSIRPGISIKRIQPETLSGDRLKEELPVKEELPGVIRQPE
jgi:hypothetical protein